MLVVDSAGGHNDANNMQMAANAQQNVRTCQIEPKMPNLPAGSTVLCADELDSVESHGDALSEHRDVPCAEVDVYMAANTPQIVRTSRKRLKSLNSPRDCMAALR